MAIKMKTIEDFILAEDIDIFSYFKSTYTGEIETTNHYFYKEGTQPFYLIAHVDTWQSKDPVLKTTNNKITNKSGILGADDRAGVYAIDRILKETDLNPHILLCNWEETGGIGVKKFIKDKPDFTGIELFIELDMYGCNYCATYGCTDWIDKKYVDFYKDNGWDYSYGGYTDIYELTRHAKIPNLNFSVCYDNQHTKDEILHVDKLEENIERFKTMFKSLPL